MDNDVISWTASGFATIGTLANNYRKKSGFVFWMIANCIWIYFDLFVVVNIPQMIQFAFFAIMNIHGWKQWSKR